MSRNDERTAAGESACDLSIVICTRNRAASLSGTLAALAAIRSEHDWEVLLVDNNSTDDTADVIRAADDCGGRLRYLLANRIGLGAARDFAWRQARGRLIAFTDDDCYPAVDFVDAWIDAFARRPEMGCMGGRILLHDPADAPVTIDESTEPRSYPAYSFLRTGAVQGANLAFPHHVLETVGGFDPELGAGTPFPCEDIDVAARVVWAGFPIGFDPGPSVRHHHGRRGDDVYALWHSYDVGRGAYYSKFILRPDSRWLYARKWARLAVSARHVRSARERVKRELISAWRYARRRRPSGRETRN